MPEHPRNNALSIIEDRILKLEIENIELQQTINQFRPFTSEEIEFLYNQLDNERNDENDNDFFWRLYEKLSLMRER